jgi:alpha-amylase
MLGRLRSEFLMSSVCLCLFLHQPYRIRHYNVFDTGTDYIDHEATGRVMTRAADTWLLPTLAALGEAIQRFDGQFSLSLGISGCALEQMKEHCPPAIDLLAQATATNGIHWLGQPYFHSLSSLYSHEEFTDQVQMHGQMIDELFGQKPSVLANAELIYNNELGSLVSTWPAWQSILLPGHRQSQLDSQSPPKNSQSDSQDGQVNHAYKVLQADPSISTQGPTLLLRDELLTRHFAGIGTGDLDLNTFLNALDSADEPVTILCLPLEDFHDSLTSLGVDDLAGDLAGELDGKATTGLSGRLEALIQGMLGLEQISFTTPDRCIEQLEITETYTVSEPMSWAYPEGDLSPWQANAMQSSAAVELYKLEKQIKQSGDQTLLRDWRCLSSSDHFFYMCTQYFAYGDAHKAYSPYESPYDSYINFMNVLDNIRFRAETAG